MWLISCENARFPGHCWKLNFYARLLKKYGNPAEKCRIVLKMDNDPLNNSANDEITGYLFDDYTVDTVARRLLKGDEAVSLPSRVFDVLVFLVENRRRPVPKDEIIAAIWKGVVVTDDSLIHAISVLHRTFSDERYDPKYIETIPRRGYRFIGAVETLVESPDQAVAAPHQGNTSASAAPRPQELAATVSASREEFPFRFALTAVISAVVVLFLLNLTESNDGVSLLEGQSAPSVRLFQAPPEGTDVVSGGVLSPNGKFLAFVARQTGEDQDGSASLWVRSLQNGDVWQVPGTQQVSKPFWSPDSRQLGYFANGKLLTTDLYGNTIEAVTAVGSPAGATWGADNRILFADWPRGLFVVPASGDGEIQQVASLEGDAEDIALAWPQFLPDNRRYIYQVVSLVPERTGVYVGDLESGQSFKLLDTTSPATLAPPYHLLHVQQDMLIAEELDPQTLELTGRANVIARGVSEPSLTAENIVSASADLLSFEQGVLQQNVTWFSREGQRLDALAIPTTFFNPRISPDGKRLLASSSITDNPGLWLGQLERGEYARLETDAIGPVWSPDGKHAAFTTRGGLDMQVRDLDGNGASRLISSSNAVKILNDWTVDGSAIVYTRQNESKGLDLWTIRVQDGTEQPLLATPFTESQARLSPQGDWIAYVSDESGQMEVYVARYPGLDDKRQISNGGGGQPQWRSDQGELYYLSQDRAIMAVPVSLSAGTDFGSPRKLFRTAIAGNPDDARDSYAVDSHGERFLIDNAITDNSDQAITVIVNWSAGLLSPEFGMEIARSP